MKAFYDLTIVASLLASSVLPAQQTPPNGSGNGRVKGTLTFF
jgi:hypothetical protein